MPLSSFHPVIARWWTQRFSDALTGPDPTRRPSRGDPGRAAEPTEAQRRGWAAIREGGHTLIAAPTGSGKTLAAFLTAIDDLLREGLERPLPDQIRVVYVSPLKALSADIHRNLAEPRREIRQIAEQLGLPPVRITAAVRTGDTPQSERAAMLRTPPHILVTTPESLYLLLTAERSRALLSTARTVIVDEIHAVLESRRGAHLALSLERLDHVCGRRLQRIGLSATQNPIEEVAAFLVGTNGCGLAQDSGRSNAAVGAPDRPQAGAQANAQANNGRVRQESAAAAEAATATQNRNPESHAPALAHAPADEIDGTAAKIVAPGESGSPGSPRIIDSGHLRHLDIAIEVPESPLEAVMAAESWQEVHERLVSLIEQHRTTLVFVNTRRLAERLARALSERLGEAAVTSHHGSLSRDVRLDAEERLKTGQLKALVATASLELGIDIGHVDLVCQIGSPRRIAAFLQRVGRSGHTVAGTPKGRLFPLTRDDLVECTALLRAVRRGELDRVIIPDKPLDVLAQQIVAETAAEDWNEDALFERLRGAWPYRTLERSEFDDVVSMLAQGFTTRRGRRAALLHYDAVNRRIRGRRGARLAAITSGGAIPEITDFRVVLEPEGTFIGTLNEDFAIESAAGDIFQLGNASWRILRIETGVVRVADAEGQPPTIPFWLGEAPSRSDELSAAVSELREDISRWLDEADGSPAVVGRLADEYGLEPSAASQIITYLAETKRLLGVIPSQRRLVLERFFDDAGGMQLLLHAPFGARVNRGWGLALRKKFCRTFNFELQAAATDDGLLLSLGPQHSFPLAEVFEYLRPETLKDTLIQAVLDSPLFQTRWRWTTTLSLAVLRSRNGNKVPPQIQRMQAEDLLAAAFPDAAACLENVAGDRDVPDHPLVTQSVRDCLEEAMDLPKLDAILRDVLAGRVEHVARDLPEPSPIGHEILTARPYAFLDDAPLEERRAHAVYTRRALEPTSARDLGALDPEAIERVRQEAWPQAADADELHDALLLSGFLFEHEAAGTGYASSPRTLDGQVVDITDDVGSAAAAWGALFRELSEAGRAARVSVQPMAAPADAGPDNGSSRQRGQCRGAPVQPMWVATERVRELIALFPSATVEPAVTPPPGHDAAWQRHDALRELLRGRLEVLGPVTAAALAAHVDAEESEVDVALMSLEAEGVILRGHFTPGLQALEWCDRRLLARIHRYTLDRLRAEIQPVNGADLMRFLLRWQRVEPGSQARGADGLAAVLEQLDGFELAAAAWEADVLPARVEHYSAELLDQLCLTGRVAWGRLSAAVVNGACPALVRSSPMALFLRRNAPFWLGARPRERPTLSGGAAQVLEALERRGACFFDELVTACRMLPTHVEQALGELAALGVVTSDGFTGLRALLTPSEMRKPIGTRPRRRRAAVYGVDTAGRWAVLSPAGPRTADDGSRPIPTAATAGDAVTVSTRRPPARDAARARRYSAEHIELFARTLLRRYGVVFRRILARETNAPPWRELAAVYRRLEARGEIRGGRFVAAMTGEQFARPEAVPLLRAVRREARAGRLIAISAADPLNLTGIITPGDRVSALAGNRILFRDGVPIAAVEKRAIRTFAPGDLDERTIRVALTRRPVDPALRPYLKAFAARGAATTAAHETPRASA